jgi:hypothetical protein
MAKIRTVARNNHPIAMGLFIVAYIGVLVILFAPKGTFNELPGVAHQTSQASVVP